jgi:murein DD-endopeptidase MepM/ murein hydrolase activator NlpD
VERKPRRYTILILPHARSRFRKLHVSRGFIVAAAIGAGALALAGLILPHQVFRAASQAAEIEDLRDRNEKLEQATRQFEESVAELNERLGLYEARAMVIAEELGIDELPVAEPAAGGASDAVTGSEGAFSEEFDALRGRAVRLDRSFDQIDGAWEERVRMLASTPNMMPIRGWFSHGYGWRKDPFTGKRAFHRGIDIVAPSGTPIKAPADGVITAAGRDGGYGKKIDISHGYGYVTRYGHLSELLSKPGQRVRRGEVIGRVGSTGRSTSPHLHYEIFRDGKRVNPWKYLGDKGF